MALCQCTAGRITEVVGGHQYRRVYVCGLYDDPFDRRNWKAEKIGFHQGLQRENLMVDHNFIRISGMKVVKRSLKVIQRHGRKATRRPDFVIPLQLDLFDNPFWNQLVPFGYLIIKYLQEGAPTEGKLFPFQRQRAYHIIREVTGNYPNWFRAQAENFYGNYILKDTIKLSKFVNIQDPKHVKHYINYSWEEQLRNKELAMNFDWIPQAVQKIKQQLRGEKP